MHVPSQSEKLNFSKRDHDAGSVNELNQPEESDLECTEDASSYGFSQNITSCDYVMQRRQKLVFDHDSSDLEIEATDMEPEIKDDIEHEHDKNKTERNLEDDMDHEENMTEPSVEYVMVQGDDVTEPDFDNVMDQEENDMESEMNKFQHMVQQMQTLAQTAAQSYKRQQVSTKQFENLKNAHGALQTLLNAKSHECVILSDLLGKEKAELMKLKQSFGVQSVELKRKSFAYSEFSEIQVNQLQNIQKSLVHLFLI